MDSNSSSETETATLHDVLQQIWRAKDAPERNVVPLIHQFDDFVMQWAPDPTAGDLMSAIEVISRYPAFGSLAKGILDAEPVQNLFRWQSMILEIDAHWPQLSAIVGQLEPDFQEPTDVPVALATLRLSWIAHRKRAVPSEQWLGEAIRLVASMQHIAVPPWAEVVKSSKP